jgi:N-acetylmuramoyl-L-alanine amidase
MKKTILSIIIFLISFSSAYAIVDIDVVYPRSGQRVALLDSTFIFGSVTPGAELTINDIPIDVHKGGGWLAFLPLEPGEFVFNIVAVLEGDSSMMEWPIQVGPLTNGNTGRPRIPNSMYPNNDVIYSVGDMFTFSYKAPPDGSGWFKIGEGLKIKMMPDADDQARNLNSVFGDLSAVIDSENNYIRYFGQYRLTENDIGTHDIKYSYRHFGNNAGEIQGRSGYLNTDSILMVLPEYPSTVGILSGTSHIIRTGPRRGYKLLYLPPGIKMQITGKINGFYKFKLGDNISGYTNVDSVTILPQGSRLKQGLVSFIRVDDYKDGVELSFNVGEQLPYEIIEDTDFSKITIDLFGVTGDVDWIRYNNKNDLVKTVRWTQPSDGIFKVEIDLTDNNLAGYKAYYENNKFYLRLKQKPKPDGGLFAGPLKGLKILIDPGHSHDTGAVGPTSLREKDANLWIAHELRQILFDKGADVLMTRYGHENIKLYDRPDIAEEWGADLLISIHNNALPDGVNPLVNNGTSVYYYHPHSKLLAEFVHKRMIKATKLDDHGLYYGNLVLTRPTFIPAILVECAFMMIPEQEAMLKTDKFQKKCAIAITDGIEDYIKSTASKPRR